MIFYRIFSILLFPLIELYLIIRLLQKKEDKSRITERLGNPTKARPEGEIIWVHAVSVGEANSSLILIEEILQKNSQISVLITTTTITSAAIIEQKLAQFNGCLIHQFLPVDSFYPVKKFLNFWQPKAAIFLESEIWPNLLDQSRARGIKTFLVNCRISDKSARKWQIARFLGLKIFDLFSAIFVQINSDLGKVKSLTKNEVFAYGNLKSQAQNLFVDAEKLANLKAEISERKIFVAASTHKGEEQLILESFKKLCDEFPDLLLVLVIRHPNRALEVKELAKNYQIAQRSLNEKIDENVQIYLVDTLGEMGIFYSLNDFAFIGGSLLDNIGGHNPFEAIKLDCAVISGKFVVNFSEIYSQLGQGDACKIIEGSDELALEVKQFLDNKDLVQKTNQNAQKVISSAGNISQKIVTKIDEILGK